MAQTNTTAVLSVRIRTEAEVKAEALREAAEDLYSDDGPGNPLSTATWLRNRADALQGTHRCDTGVFDRTLCPEPCDTMHSYCAECGARQDPCAHDASQA